jgi:hypothetical protein
VEVLVVIKFIAATPALAQIIGPAAYLYLSKYSITEEVYF